MTAAATHSRFRRRAFTLLETQVAFVLLGIGLAGVCPLVVMQLKLSRKVAQGLDPASAYFGAGRTYFLSPADDQWSRKLGVAASILDSDPSTTSGSSSATPAYVVSIVSAPERTNGNESVTVHVSVTRSSTSTSGP